MGGVLKCFIIDAAAADTAWSVTSGVATEDSAWAAGTTTLDYYTYELARGSASFNQEVQATPANGSVAFVQTLTFSAPTMTAADNLIFHTLIKNRCSVVVLDNNGNYWLMGLNNGCDVTAGTFGLGQAPGDLNGYTLTFTAEEQAPAPSVDLATAPTKICINGIGDCS